MFIKLYKSFFVQKSKSKENFNIQQINENLVIVVTDTKFVVNTDHIVYIDTEPILTNTNVFYKIKVANDSTNGYYILKTDFENIYMQKVHDNLKSPFTTFYENGIPQGE